MMRPYLALLLSASFLATAGAASAAPAQGGSNGICLKSDQIKDTRVVDDSTILFYLRGGQIYKNDLQAPCFNLKFQEGFTYRTNFSELCSGAQSIKVLRWNTACQLGQFSPLTAEQASLLLKKE